MGDTLQEHARSDAAPPSTSEGEDRVGGDTRGSGPFPGLPWLTGHAVVKAALALVAAQLLVRAWVLGNGYFQSDDLIAAGRSGRLPLFSADLLLYDHDGHFMPLGFLLTGLLTRAAPYEWWPMAIALLLLQAGASLAVWRLLRSLLGDRAVTLVPLAVYLFSPLTLHASTWWFAAVNALPLQAALAWVAGDAVKYLRTGRTRYAVTAPLVLALSFGSFEKSVVVPVVAFGVAALLRRSEGDPTPIVSALRRGARLWWGLLGVTAAWALLYTRVVGSPVVGEENAGTFPHAVDFITGSIVRGLMPALAGGPLRWTEGFWADPPAAMTAFACVALVLLVVWSSWQHRGTGAVWWLFAAYVSVSALALLLGRFSNFAGDALALALRHYGESAVVFAVALAFIARAPVRPERAAGHESSARLRAGGTAVLLLAFLFASLSSTISFAKVWADNPTRSFIRTAEASLAAADAPLLDEAIPERILWRLVYPHNLYSWVFAPIEDRPEFAQATPDLRVLDESGHLIEAEVTRLRSLQEGGTPGCGHVVSDGTTTAVPLDGPLIGWGWTLRLDYVAESDGLMDVAIGAGQAIRTPVEAGAHTVYVRALGEGDAVRITGATPGLRVCIDRGHVGLVQPAG